MDKMGRHCEIENFYLAEISIETIPTKDAIETIETTESIETIDSMR